MRPIVFKAIFGKFMSFHRCVYICSFAGVMTVYNIIGDNIPI